MFDTVGSSLFFPTTNRDLLNFITFLHEGGMSGTTISTYLSAISFFCKLLSCYDATQTFAAKKLLGAVRKITGDLDTRLPITPSVLTRLIGALGRIGVSCYGEIMLRSAYLLAFHAFLRVGEFTSNNGNQHTIMLKDVCWQRDSSGKDMLQVSILSFKNKKNRGPVTLLIQRHPDLTLCPILACSKYLSIRPNAPGALFVWESGSPLTRHCFTSLLRLNLIRAGLNTEVYKSHSFRIGACTYASSMGVPDEKIKKMGRWVSSAFLKYVRVPTRLISIP